MDKNIGLYRGKAKNKDDYIFLSQAYQDRCFNGWVFGQLLIDNITDRYYICVAVAAKMNCTIANGIVTAIEVIPETIGRHAELIDKNDRRIYEGDIVKVNDDYDTYGLMAGEVREVWFNSGGYRLKPKYDSSISRGDRGYWIEDGNDFEVIGNIHDNPELIGGNT